MSRRGLLLVALSVSLLACTQAISFVTRNGVQLKENGQPFRFVGADAYWLLEAAADPDLSDDVAQFFARAKALGLKTVRTWALAPNPSTPGSASSPVLEPGTQPLRALDSIVQQAGVAGMRLLLTLAKPELQLITSITSHVNALTGVTYKEDPTILGWDLASESHCSGCGTPVTDTGYEPWVRQIREHLAAAAPNQLVVTSSTGHGAAGDVQEENVSGEVGGWRRKGLLQPQSVTSIPGVWSQAVPSQGRLNVNFEAYLAWFAALLDLHSRTASSAGEPILLQELYMQSGAFNDQQRAALFQLAADKLAASEGTNGALAGIMFPTALLQEYVLTALGVSASAGAMEGLDSQQPLRETATDAAGPAWSPATSTGGSGGVEQISGGREWPGDVQGWVAFAQNAAKQVFSRLTMPLSSKKAVDHGADEAGISTGRHLLQRAASGVTAANAATTANQASLSTNLNTQQSLRNDQSTSSSGRHLLQRAASGVTAANAATTANQASLSTNLNTQQSLRNDQSTSSSGRHLLQRAASGVTAANAATTSNQASLNTNLNTQQSLRNAEETNNSTGRHLLQRAASGVTAANAATTANQASLSTNLNTQQSLRNDQSTSSSGRHLLQRAASGVTAANAATTANQASLSTNLNTQQSLRNDQSTSSSGRHLLQRAASGVTAANAATTANQASLSTNLNTQQSLRNDQSTSSSGRHLLQRAASGVTAANAATTANQASLSTNLNTQQSLRNDQSTSSSGRNLLQRAASGVTAANAATTANQASLSTNLNTQQSLRNDQSTSSSGRHLLQRAASGVTAANAATTANQASLSTNLNTQQSLRNDQSTSSSGRNLLQRAASGVTAANAATTANQASLSTNLNTQQSLRNDQSTSSSGRHLL
ncbi:hypothetical protein V8C86DRAFT_187079 [Haematococcus lacustris]